MKRSTKKVIDICILFAISLLAIFTITSNYNNEQERNNLLPIEPEELINQEVKEEEQEEPKEENNEVETPTIEEPQVVETEKDKINKLFSPDINVQFAKEEYNNQDIIGRLEIPGLLNVIITQSKDNEYYSNHNINKRKDIKGNEFLDYRNTPSDSQINIYGHNSSTYDIPFRKLEKFLNKDFFNNNQYIIFQTDTVRRIYKIGSIKKTGSDYSHMDLNPSNKFEHITKLSSNAINARYVSYDENSNIIVLQTCVEKEPGNYYIIVGFEI